jgi:hypothetical protein
MWTRAEARRVGAPAAAATPAARHAALLALRKGPAHVLEAALAAIGPPGSAAVLAALAHSDHALLRRTAFSRECLDAVPPLLRAYGESPDACADAARVLDGAPVNLMQQACFNGHVAAAAAVLGAYRRAGRAREALAADEHRALRRSIRHPDVLALLLAEYGEPGSGAVLAALAGEDHSALHGACYVPCARSVALLAAAYGPPGCAALRAAVGPGHLKNVMRAIVRLPNGTCFNASLAALLAALAEPDNATAVRAVGGWLTDCPNMFEPEGPAQRLARIPPDSLLARLAVAAPAAWALNLKAARALLSAPVRASLALPALLALRRLPAGVAAPVAAHLRARRWLLFAGAADAEMQVG